MRLVFHTRFSCHAIQIIALRQDVLQHRSFLLDVAVRQCLPVFELFSCEDQSLLVGMNAFLVFHIGDGVAGPRHRT